ncbi:60s ribosomal protein l12-like, partial [Lynx pardinus]
AQIEVVTSAFVLNIKAFKETPRNRKESEKHQHSGNNTVDEMVITAQRMW